MFLNNFKASKLTICGRTRHCCRRAQCHHQQRPLMRKLRQRKAKSIKVESHPSNLKLYSSSTYIAFRRRSPSSLSFSFLGWPLRLCDVCSVVRMQLQTETQASLNQPLSLKQASPQQPLSLKTMQCVAAANRAGPGRKSYTGGRLP